MQRSPPNTECTPPILLSPTKKCHALDFAALDDMNIELSNLDEHSKYNSNIPEDPSI